MLDILVLRFDAPIFSLGGPIVDRNNITREFPSASAMTGLIGNALGYHHRDADSLQDLQRRLRYAARSDCPGQLIVDYQIVDLGQSLMCQGGWTTYRVLEKRSGGRAKTDTHPRYRWYRADSVMTVALTLRDTGASPTTDEVEQALKQPARPLFIGRKCCIPSGPLLFGRIHAKSLLAALQGTPLAHRPGYTRQATVQAWWPADKDDPIQDHRMMVVTDERDWKNQIHAGQRNIRHGKIRVSVGDTNDDAE